MSAAASKAKKKRRSPRRRRRWRERGETFTTHVSICSIYTHTQYTYTLCILYTHNIYTYIPCILYIYTHTIYICTMYTDIWSAPRRRRRWRETGEKARFRRETLAPKYPCLWFEASALAYASMRQHTSAYVYDLLRLPVSMICSACPGRASCVSICAFVPAAASVLVLLY
jgi:hypothetical protein